MKRKIWAAIMTLSMMLTLFPTGAFAADESGPSLTVIPDGLEIEGTVVTDYTGDATELTIPDGVTEIGKQAFLNDDSVKKISLPSTLTSISESAFQALH